MFRLFGGNVVAGLAILTSLLLFPRLDRTSGAVLAVLALCIIANSWWAARKELEAHGRAE
jgi:hypothetical protein